jgi:hypothetical protein
MATIARNIGLGGRRQRLVMGGVGVLVGVLAAAGLAVAGAPRGFRLALFLPFAMGAIGLLQARDHT